MIRSTLLLLSVGCATAPTAPVDAQRSTGQGVLASGTWRATTGTHRVALEQVATLRPGPVRAVFRGRASEPLDDVEAWTWGVTAPVARHLGGRRFEVALTGTSAPHALGGAPVFLTLHTSAGDTLTARVELAIGQEVTGSPVNVLSSVLTPFWAADGGPTLRLRQTWTTPTPADDVNIQTPRGLEPDPWDIDDVTWNVDWSLTQVGAALVPPGLPTLYTTLYDNRTRFETSEAVWHVEATGLALTDDAAATAWPDPGCEAAVASCVEARIGDHDFAACGSHAQVARCAAADPCLVHEEGPLALAEVDASPLVPAVAAYDATCVNNGAWCGMDQVVIYELPVCFDEDVDLEAVWDEAAALDQDLGWVFTYAWGEVHDHASLSSTWIFGTSLNPGGPDLLAAVDTFGGSTDVQAWHGTTEVPCPNCTDFYDILLMWYPATGKLVKLVGSHGYDS